MRGKVKEGKSEMLRAIPATSHLPPAPPHSGTHSESQDQRPHVMGSP